MDIAVDLLHGQFVLNSVFSRCVLSGEQRWRQPVLGFQGITAGSVCGGQAESSQPHQRAGQVGIITVQCTLFKPIHRDLPL